jgi:hypothetical protein
MDDRLIDVDIDGVFEGEMSLEALEGLMVGLRKGSVCRN